MKTSFIQKSLISRLEIHYVVMAKYPPSILKNIVCQQNI